MAPNSSDIPRFGPPIPPPQRRRLRTFAFDPMSTRLSGRFLHVDIPFETGLKPGPYGKLVHVVDFDEVRNEWYAPVDLNDPWLISQDGLRPSQGDPRSHQQVVYAVAMSVIERFERFIGRRFRWRYQQTLRLVPHAFEGQNAYFDSQRRAILFGYYRAHEENPGENIPNQMMFTCLSNDIIAHEVTHAIVHRLRQRFIESSNPDVAAWHEAFADLVALFQHFIHQDVVREAVAATAGDLRKNAGLLDLAREFGVSSGRGGSLRSAVDEAGAPKSFRASLEPHERGEIFVLAIFDAYLESYQSGIADLLRIASGGSGVLPAGSLNPDLVNRIADVAVKTADRILGIVVRAFDYLPTVDVNFGDVVRAIVTADRSVFPDDDLRLRGNLVEAFRRRGIVPRSVASLTDESLMWPSPESPLNLNTANGIDLPGLILSATMDLDSAGEAGPFGSPLGSRRRRDRNLAGSLRYWARANALELGFDPALQISLDGIHVAFRQSADHLARPEIVIQLVQRRRDFENSLLKEDERPIFRAGTTIIAAVDGRVEHVISKPLPMSPESATDPKLASMSAEQKHAAEQRLDDIRTWYSRVQDSDDMTPWTIGATPGLVNFSEMHLDAAEGKN